MPIRAACVVLIVCLATGCGSPPSDEASVRVSHWAVEHGGKVTVAGKTRELERTDQLPQPPFAIEKVVFNGTKLTDDELIELNLHELSRLKNLGLHSTHITDEGLDAIVKIGTLTDLELSNTEITDAGLAKLGDMRQLKTLYLYNNAITPDAVGRLQTRLPDCKIYR